tara:strand:- start:106 stop:744 length:639 start_codon:yes stop_codon:yes gene_type:complete
MKNILIIILSIVLATVSFGQEDTILTKQPTLKSNTLSTSVLWTMFGFLHANYGKVMNDGKNEYQFMLGTFGYGDSYTGEDSWESGLGDGYMYGFKGATGGKVTYRKYRKGNAKGLLYQAQLRMMMLVWGYKSSNNDWKDVNTIWTEPGIMLGYKYVPSFIFKERLFIEAYAGGTYSMSKPEDGNVTLTDQDSEKQGGNNFQPDFNLYIGFNF